MYLLHPQCPIRSLARPLTKVTGAPMWWCVLHSNLSRILLWCADSREKEVDAYRRGHAFRAMANKRRSSYFLMLRKFFKILLSSPAQRLFQLRSFHFLVSSSSSIIALQFIIHFYPYQRTCGSSIQLCVALSTLFFPSFKQTPTHLRLEYGRRPSKR